jgi:hypothetical protein
MKIDAYGTVVSVGWSTTSNGQKNQQYLANLNHIAAEYVGSGI